MKKDKSRAGVAKTEPSRTAKANATPRLGQSKTKVSPYHELFMQQKTKHSLETPSYNIGRTMRAAAILLGLLAMALPAKASRLLSTCDTDWGVENVTAGASSTLEIFGPADTSKFPTGIKWLCIRNDDATAGNYIYVSSFSQTSSPDTTKGWPIPGGNTADSNFCFPFGANLRRYVYTATGSRQVSALFCE